MKIEKIRVPQKLYTEMYDAISLSVNNKQATRRVVELALELAQDAYDQGRADQAEYEVGQGNSTFKRFIKNYD